jgi:catechol 2,3-dioxygenase-like lactoylglutathione lyase family enzyme
MEWYSETLGLHPIEVEGEQPLSPGSNSELLYDTGAGQFSIYVTDHVGENHATALKFVVDEFDSVHAELSEKGVDFQTFDLGVLSEPDGDLYWHEGALISPDGHKTCWFKDSEGNLLSIGTTWG